MDLAAIELRRRLARSGATLFAVGLATGLWSAAALTGQVKVDLPRLALAAHLNALLGGLWILGVAFTLEYLSHGARGLRALGLTTQASAWGNWLITLIASFVGRNGLDYKGDTKNSAIAFLLQAIVVVPGLVAGVLWAWGFRRGQSARG